MNNSQLFHNLFTTFTTVLNLFQPLSVHIQKQEKPPEALCHGGF
jgi:hypothetical protein